MYNVTKEIDFCAAHRLFNYDGLCSNIHGHNYKVQVTFSGAALDEQGMLLDFKHIKQTLKKWIDINWDHALLLYENDPLSSVDFEEPLKIFLCSWNPTAENMARHLLTVIEPFNWINCSSMKLWETPTSFVEVINA